MAEQGDVREKQSYHYEAGVPILERVSDLEDKAQKAEERDENYKNKQVSISSRMAWFTGFLVITSCISGGIGIWQARIANRAAKSAEKAVEQSRNSNIETINAQKEIAQAELAQSQQNFERTLQLTADDIHRQQRAYLSVDAPEPMLPVGVFRIPIENYGGVPSRWIRLRLVYLRVQAKPTFAYLERRTINASEHKEIYPGKNKHSLTIMIPNLSKDDLTAVLNGSQGLSIRGTITYDTGFGGSDTLTICAMHNSGKWQGCGGLSTDIDFGEATAYTPANRQPQDK